ncbi:MAG TPA: GGDEF domain-containing protein [Clostridiales bacterium]|nr:GGDEF domain-containing protein [Clostridiales bacterium]
MKERIYKFAPVVLLFICLIVFTIIFIIIKHLHGYSHSFIFAVLLICQMINSLIYGVSIKKLYRQVQIDALTGLFNRRCFNEKLYKMKSRGSTCLILIDIDNFKNINDTYGHLMGDQVLQQLAQILQNSTRKKDIIARWGGEEFAIILPETSIEDAYMIGNRIRTKVENYIFSYEEVICNITVSIGIAAANTSKDIDPDQFLKITDEALYDAKKKKNNISAVMG